MPFSIWILTIFASFLNAEVVQLTVTNFNTTLKDNELVFVDFYASWCYFSSILEPIFRDASNKLELDFKDKGKVIFGKVECEEQNDIATHFNIMKYPTLKLFRFGEICKREYRGARSADGMVEFIKSELIDPNKELEANANFTGEIGKIYVTGFFQSKLSPNLNLFKKMGYQLRDSCQLYFRIIPDLPMEKLTHETFEHSGNSATELTDLSDMVRTKEWIKNVCTPTVRNITFQNAEDITEEGLPLVLLFYKRFDPLVTSLFTRMVTENFTEERKSVNFLYADAETFSHPLMHLGKTNDDLPLICIDSFQHMFMLPRKVDDVLQDPTILKKFITDLLSEKLHKEFHDEPDSVSAAAISKEIVNEENEDNDEEDMPPRPPPIQSIFKKLRPSNGRYTLHDEF